MSASLEASSHCVVLRLLICFSGSSFALCFESHSFLFSQMSFYLSQVVMSLLLVAEVCLWFRLIRFCYRLVSVPVKEFMLVIFSTDFGY